MKNCISLALVVAGLFSLNIAAAQVSGTKTIPGDYATIGAALEDIQTSGLSGNVILELQQSYYWHNEFYPLVIPQNFPATEDATVTLRPAAGATDVYVGTGFLGGGPMPTGDNPIFEIHGSYFNIDGRPGGTGTAQELYIWSSAYEGTAVEFGNIATNNVVSYCHLIGTNNYANPFGLPVQRKGVITFNSLGPTNGFIIGGTNSNTVEHNIVEGVILGGGSFVVSPFYGIYAIGTPNTPHIGNKILNNEFRNFTYSGIEIKTEAGGGGWIIKGNSFYSTLPDYYPDYAINLTHTGHAGTNIIEDNFIGGNAPLAEGKWQGGPWFGIVCNTYGGGDSVSVRNNVIKNMEKILPLGSPAISPLHKDEFIGMAVQNSSGSNKVHCSNNLIGGNTTDFGIRVRSEVESRGTAFYGMIYNNCSGGALTQNTIQNIREFLAGTTSSIYFIGIKALIINNVTVSQNVIQNATLQTNAATNVYPIFITDDHHEVIPCEPFSTPPVVENNTVQSINVISNGLPPVTFDGLLIKSRYVKVLGNTVGSPSNPNDISLPGGSNVLANAIYIEGPAYDVSVLNNNISNITPISSSGLNTAAVNGIYFNGSGTIALSGNSIKSLAAYDAKGIYLAPASGVSSATVNNNIIAGTGVSSGTGIQANVTEGANLNFVANGNTVNTWQTGFNITAAPGSTLTQTVQGNYVTGNQTGYINNSSSPQNATCNWWGSGSGPSGAGPGTGDPVGPNVIFSPWAIVSTFVAVDAGADQTIYLGYGASSKTITPAYTVCGSPTYLWSTGATTPTVTVTPIVTTTYSVTVKDGNGHSAADNITIIVKDIRCGTDKVKICHKESATKKKTLCVNKNDVAYHLAHGDALGECTSSSARFAYGSNETETVYEKMLSVYPNPASDKLVLQWKAEKSGMAFIKATDMAGRSLLQQTIPENKGNNQKALPLKGLAAGNYILIMQAGGETHAIKFAVVH
jgi:Secretion system C-terminal sorting domain